MFRLPVILVLVLAGCTSGPGEVAPTDVPAPTAPTQPMALDRLEYATVERVLASQGIACSVPKTVDWMTARTCSGSGADVMVFSDEGGVGDVYVTVLGVDHTAAGPVFDAVARLPWPGADPAAIAAWVGENLQGGTTSFGSVAVKIATLGVELGGPGVTLDISLPSSR